MIIQIDSYSFTTEEALESPLLVTADLKYAKFDSEIGVAPYDIEDIGLVQFTDSYESLVDIDAMTFNEDTIGSGLLASTKFSDRSLQYTGFHDQEPDVESCLQGYDESGIIYIILQYPENGQVGEALYGLTHLQGDQVLFSNDD